MRRDRSKRGEQFLRIMLYGHHIISSEKVRKGPLHHLTVLKHVADPGGRREVILQYVIFSIASPHNIRANNMDITVPGHVKVHHLAAEVAGAKNKLGRYPLFAQDSLFVVNVMQEQVERCHTLRDAS